MDLAIKAAEEANVDHLIRFSCCDIADYQIGKEIDAIDAKYQPSSMMVGCSFMLYVFV